MGSASHLILGQASGDLSSSSTNVIEDMCRSMISWNRITIHSLFVAMRK